MTHNNIQVNGDFLEVGIKQLDDRKRITIGDAILFKEVSRYKIYKNNKGDLLLRPIVEIPAYESWLYQNSDAYDSVKRGIKQSAEGKTSLLDPELLAPEDDK